MEGRNFIPPVLCALVLASAGGAQADVGFVAGSETEPDSWALAPVAFVSPPKADITSTWLSLDATVLLARLTLAKDEGTALAALELNQRAPGYRESGGVPLPTRTDGDRLLALGLGPGGLEAGLCRWQGDEHAGSWQPLDPAAPAAGMTGCSTGGASAGMDGTAVEAALDLAAPGTPPACFAWFHTRAAEPVSASPRDLTAVTPLPAAPGCTAPVEEMAAMLPAAARGLPRPEAGKTVNVYPLRGRVKVRRRGAAALRALDDEAQIPVGSLVDASDGEVKIVSARGTVRGTQTGKFSEGAFVVRQRRARHAVTELVLSGSAGAARAAAKPARPKLWAEAKGRFRTRGKHAAATVRGTRWYIEDRPNGTFIKVLEGVVSVRDYVRPWTVLVSAGESYLTRRRVPR